MSPFRQEDEQVRIHKNILTARTYRTTEKENLKVIRASRKQKVSQSQIIRNLINNNL